MPTVKCKICDKEFYAKPNWIRMGWGKYCSKSCQYKSQKKGLIVKCFICNKEVYKSPKVLGSSKSGNYFCNKSCQAVWRNNIYIGKLHPNWTSGISIYRHLLTKSGKSQVCVLCKNADTRVLAVHHIDKNRNNNQLTNLAWLCHNCHYLIHHYDTEKQIFSNILVSEVRNEL